MLTYDSALEALQSRLSEEFPYRTITEHTTFSDIGMDSLDLIQFVKNVEDQFLILLPEESLGDIETVGTLARAIVALTP